MSEELTPKEFIRLLRDLQNREDVRPEYVPAAELQPQILMLQQWQSDRLARTYADLLADKQYRAAALFCLSDIYAARDFSQRDRDAERIYEILTRFLPD